MRTVRGALCALLLTTLVAGQASAAPVTVNLRVEGQSQTLYEAPVTTDGHDITKDASGAHPCDGTNGGANPSPGPTMTSALDDAFGSGWAGTWFDGFEDFGIDAIGGEANDFGAGAFWGYALDFAPTSVGGCQQQVSAGQEVLYAYDFFSKSFLLRLSGPASAKEGEDFTVTVTDGTCGCAISGATVGGATTDANGQAVLRFQSAGNVTLKAERADSVRSNALTVEIRRDSSTTTPAPTTPAPGTPAGTGADTGANTPAPGDPAAGASSFGSLDPRVVHAILREAVQGGDMRMPASGVLRRRFANPFAFPVTGAITLRAIGRVAPLGGASAARRPRSVRLGSAVFAVGANETGTVRLRLTRAGRELVRRGGRLVVRQSARVRDTRGSVRTVTGRFVLSAPRR